MESPQNKNGEQEIECRPETEKERLQEKKERR